MQADEPQDMVAFTRDGGSRCEHCSEEAVVEENGVQLCERHLQEYQVRNA